jgi:F-type H+-transporting ATPase subunit b
MLQTADFWVGVAFVAFFAVLYYFKVHTLIAKALDNRAVAIKEELDQARRLREEAQTLLADYQKKQRNAEREAAEIIEEARRNAETYAQETRTALKDTLERRTRQAQEKIARAEAQAVEEVRAAAVDAAITAAEKVLREKAAGATGAAITDESIRSLQGRLN